ncbi:MAG: SAM-dependent methyltransferase [Candidatus Promineifilaceae bacterium]
MTEDKIDINAAAGTAIGPTVMVAMEQNFPATQRVIHDDLALKVLPASYQFTVKVMRTPFLRDWMVTSTEQRLKGGWSGIICRKRYIDERVEEAVTDGSIDAIVNLGAGFDTRLYRLPALANVPAWEADQPANIEAKKAALKKALGQVPANVTLVPINFMEEDIGAVLAAHGYDIGSRTFFIWEAVSQYLTETAVRRTFDFFAQAGAGSQLVFTYILKDFIEGKNYYVLEKTYKQLVVKSHVWHYGFAPQEMVNFLGEYGWHLVEDLGYDDLNERYMKPTGRDLPSMAIERMVYAEKS